VSYFESSGWNKVGLADLSTKRRAQANLIRLQNSKGETVCFSVFRDKDLGVGQFGSNNREAYLFEDSLIESVR
jgi:hypothetical protein